jgi:hypothetical protein
MVRIGWKKVDFELNNRERIGLLRDDKTQQELDFSK